MTTKNITEISVLTALAIILDLIAAQLGVALFPNGGSISIAMIPIFIVGIRNGLASGLISGFLVGFIQIFLPGAYVISFFQGFLDYILAYTVLGIVGLCKYEKFSSRKYIYIFITLAVFLRLLAHVTSGYLYFFESGIEGMSASLYVWFYNLSYLLPTLIISLILIFIIDKKYSELLER